MTIKVPNYATAQAMAAADAELVRRLPFTTDPCAPDWCNLRPGCILGMANSVGRQRRWLVTGVFYGGMGQEDLVGLRAIDGASPGSAYGESVLEMQVPYDMVRVTCQLVWIAPRP